MKFKHFQGFQGPLDTQIYTRKTTGQIPLPLGYQTRGGGGGGMSECAIQTDYSDIIGLTGDQNITHDRPQRITSIKTSASL